MSRKVDPTLNSNAIMPWEKIVNKSLVNWRPFHRSSFTRKFFRQNAEYFKEKNISFSMLLYMIYAYNKEIGLRAIEDGFRHQVYNIGDIQVFKKPGRGDYQRFNFIKKEYEIVRNEWFYVFEFMVTDNKFRFYPNISIAHLLWIASEKIKKFEMPQIYETIDTKAILQAVEDKEKKKKNLRKVKEINDRLKFDGELAPIRKRKRGASKDTEGHKRQIDG